MVQEHVAGGNKYELVSVEVDDTRRLPMVKGLAVKRLALALMLILIPLGCGSEAKEPDSASPGNQSEGTDSADQLSRETAVYAAVIRQLVTKDHTFGGGDPGFEVVYVMDGVVAGAGKIDGNVEESDPAQPFSDEVKAGLLSGLADLPPIEFVSERSSVLVGTNSGTAPGNVKNSGVLISLGPIEGNGTKIEVGNSLWINGLAGQWQTYVLRARDGAWKVVGTTGPVAIS
jgi:hypothetical protein